MLTRTTKRIAVAAAVVIVSSFAVASGPAEADVITICDPECRTRVVTPGTPGGGGPGGGSGGGGGSVTCALRGGYSPTNEPVPCFDPRFGWVNPNDGCYWRLADPQPAPDSPIRAGQPPGASLYWRICSFIIYGPWPPAWSVNPPPRAPTITPAQLAAEAVKLIDVRGAEIGIVPDRDGAGLTGLPVWLWTTVTPHTWGPLTVTASVPGLSVTATARASQIVWDMGDGHSVTCGSPGTPYQPSYEAKPSPTCPYTYTASSRSRPDGRYVVTATTTWQVEWAGGGQGGVITTTRQAQTTVRIEELQVVTR